MKTDLLWILKFILILSNTLICFMRSVHGQPAGEGAYRFIGNLPDEATPGWHEEAQGIAHDDNYWFITQKNALWKIPLGHDLNSPSAGAPGVIHLTLNSVPRLVEEGYTHMGDPECHDGFLFVPMEFGKLAIAVFDAETLNYLSHAYVPDQTDAPWCAVDPEGNLYSSNYGSDFESISSLFRYEIDWPALRNQGELVIQKTTKLNLLDEAGGTSSLYLNKVQGGVITPSGSLLYLVANAIHVFDLSTHRRIRKSENGSGYFNFEYDDTFNVREEPEGITFWDFEDGRAPGISGGLHVLVLDNEDFADDDIYLKHYTSVLYVDHAGIPGDGSWATPFPTVGIGNALIWGGGRLCIKGGQYSEALTFSKSISVHAYGGSVTIGE